MVKLDAITQEVLDKISEGFGQSGAFNLRQNGISLCHGDSEHIKIKTHRASIFLLTEQPLRRRFIFLLW